MRTLVRNTLLVLVLTAMAAPLAAQEIRQLRPKNGREGFFLGLGLASGQFDNECDVCGDADPASAFGSHIRLGGTLSPKFRLGADLFGITTSEGQFADLSGAEATETVGDVTLSTWFYPSARGNFWLQLGVGGIIYQADVDGDQKYTAAAGGAVFGLGYDFRVGRNGSLTPYLRWAGGGEGELKDEDGSATGPAEWKTRYVAVGVDYVFH